MVAVSVILTVVEVAIASIVLYLASKKPRFSFVVSLLVALSVGTKLYGEDEANVTPITSDLINGQTLQTAAVYAIG